MEQRKNQHLSLVLWVLLGCFVVKLILAAVLPMTGDEAYYQIWGMHWIWGGYDHTPFVGWFLYPFLLISHNQVMVRFPTILVTSFIGFAIYWFLKSYDEHKAALLSILYFISPISLGGVFTTTDVPLILFSFLSGLFLFFALKKEDHLGYYFLAGICLGLAFFSKYFAVLLALAYFIYFLAAPKSRKRTLGFIILFLCVLPFGLENIYWNYTHAWANILFNIYNRNDVTHFQWHTILLYLLILVYIVTPPLFYYFCKHAKRVFRKPKHREFSILLVSIFIPFLFFLALSTIKSIGLHWPLSFIPFVYLVAVLYLSTQEIRRCIKFMVWFTAIHLILLGIIVFTPVTAWQHVGVKGHKYADLVFVLKHPQIRKQLNQYNKKYIIASPSYAKADLLYIDSDIYSPTFGRGSVHGREGDFITDYRNYRNKDFAILETKVPDLNRYRPYFRWVRVKRFQLYDATFYVVLGYHFKYEKYRDSILKQINERYWQVPKYLPYAKTFYCKKYFKECPSNPI